MAPLEAWWRFFTSTGVLDFVERHLHDFRSGLLSSPASGEIVLVTIDRQSLQRQPGWPWPREYHATVIERLIDAGATKIAVAIDFSTRSVSTTIDV